MREILLETVYENVYKSIKKMNVYLPDDVKTVLKKSADEENGLGKKVIESILKNIELAEKKNMPLCQDTGMVLMFVEIGSDIHFNGHLEETLHKAVEDAYLDGYFRKSVVSDPLNDRQNSGNNLPPVIHYNYKNGDSFKIDILAKGFGSENKSQTFMLNPTAGEAGVIEAVVKTVKDAGGSPCPPTILGIGIGGTLDKAALLSKQALTRELDDQHPDPFYAELEKKILNAVNKTGIGGGGLGGIITSLAVKIEKYPTHIAGLPLAVTVNCWADRKAKVVL